MVFTSKVPSGQYSQVIQDLISAYNDTSEDEDKNKDQAEKKVLTLQAEIAKLNKIIKTFEEKEKKEDNEPRFKSPPMDKWDKAISEYRDEIKEKKK